MRGISFENSFNSGKIRSHNARTDNPEPSVIFYVNSVGIYEGATTRAYARTPQAIGGGKRELPLLGR